MHRTCSCFSSPAQTSSICPACRSIFTVHPIDHFLCLMPASAHIGFHLPAAIPFIVHPIDNAIHALLNLSMRPAMRKYICGQGQGAQADLAICDDECKVPET